MMMRTGRTDERGQADTRLVSRIAPGIAVLLCVALCACGFQLRGQATLPFETLYVPSNSPMSIALKRNIIAGTNTRLVDDAKQAQAVLTVLAEAQEKSILSLNSAGRVREYRLGFRYNFRVADLKGLEFLPPTEVFLTRDITFNDSQVLAKENEEALLYRDMQADMVQQVLRRLSAAKTPVPPAE
jgi:LPS-assembly lipoprotein